MEAVTQVPVGVPALSPALTALIEAMSKKGADERSVALEMSLDIRSLRTQVVQLARALNLPEQNAPADEFKQVAREARRLAAEQTKAVENIREKLKLNGVDNKEIAAWQEQLVKVGAAIARGTLVSVDPYKLRPMFGQPRDFFPQEEQELLEDSLGLMGQIQDLIIRKKLPPKSNFTNTTALTPDPEKRIWRVADTEYEICDGERRWRGALSKGLTEVRAKLIDIDDEGAYLVAGVSNFNRVGHTTLEKARNLKRIIDGPPPFPLPIAAAMQGISIQTANKLLDALNLPADIQALMDPKAQRGSGAMVLGPMPTYALARLSNPRFHDDARRLANRYVAGEMKMPELGAEVDRILSRSGAARDVLAERQQPARRLKFAARRVSLAAENLRDGKARLQDMKEEGVLPLTASALKREVKEITELCAAISKIIDEEPKKH